MPSITCIEDLRQLSRQRVPRMFYDLVDAGSYTGSTYRANAQDLAALRFRQRVAANVDQRSTGAKMAGQDVRMPVAIAPTGLAGMIHADGEILGARAAAEFGIPFILSTMSVCSIEDVASASDVPFWFQLYFMRDRDFVARLIDRAAAAKCSALVVTLDLPLVGQRHKDIHNGLTGQHPRPIGTLLDIARRPRWAWSMAQTQRRGCGNVIGHAPGVSRMSDVPAWAATQFDPRVTWADLEWLRKRWRGPLILKGVLDVDDARIAAASGANALIVSNHGGRQLDGARSTISVLPEIADSVGRDIEVWMDGGISSGQDVLKACALGARGTLIGRSWLYGLGASGQSGVTRCLEIIQSELDVTMAFCGLSNIAAADHLILHRPA